MALIKCPECSREVSTFATACPGCGFPLGVPVHGMAGAAEAYQPSASDKQQPSTREDVHASASSSFPAEALPVQPESLNPTPVATSASLRPPQAPKKPSARALIVGVGLLGVGVLIAVAIMQSRKPTKEQCDTAVRRLYEAQGWGLSGETRVSWEDSVRSCMEVDVATVKCLGDRDKRTYECDGASDINIDRDVRHNIFCYTESDNSTGSVTGGKCTFTDRDCEEDRESDVRFARGATFSACTKEEIAYGIPSTDSSGWYGLAPRREICEQSLERSRSTLNNIAPCCVPVNDDGIGPRDCSDVLAPTEPSPSEQVQPTATDAQPSPKGGHSAPSSTPSRDEGLRPALDPNSKPNLFTIGDSKEIVEVVQGTPTSIIGDTWMYDLSSVRFTRGQVVSFSNISGNLRVRLFSSARTKTPITVGSTKDAVVAIQGTPTSIVGDTWLYDLSSIRFSQGKVVGYSNISGNLRLARTEGKAGATSPSTSDPLASLDIPERPSRDDISNAMLSVRPDVATCGATHGGAGTTVTVNIKIGPKGAVSSARATSSNSALGECVERAVKVVVFPESQLGISINYPFVF